MKSNHNNLRVLSKIKEAVSTSKFSAKLVFFVMGIGATIWFLVRVIPKPQRAGYPCMRAAAPIMSGFVLYLLSLGGITLLFKKFVSNVRAAKYWSAFLAFVLCIGLLAVFNLNQVETLYAKTVGFKQGELPDGSNNPMGKGKGIYPGRVVWSWSPGATNINCPNTISDAYFMAKNNNQDTINKMADESIKKLAGIGSVVGAWDAIFNDFNKGKSGVAEGYKTGQTIFIKVNNGQAGWAINKTTMAETGNNSATGVSNAAMSGTTPFTVVALIRQLVDSCGVPQDKIFVAEPMTHVYKSMYDAVHKLYPNVIVLDNGGGAGGVTKSTAVSLGRTISSGWKEDALVYSDNGDEMPDAVSDALMNEMYNADYMINVAALKAHARNGVTFGAKNHFGSHGDHPGYGYGSFHLHDGLIATVDNDVLTSGVRGEYGMYRVLVDLMGHEKLGGNTVLFVMDGLWGGIEATDMPVKWKSAPFNKDFPSSLFFSQDDVALESVCLDFLRAESEVNTAFKNRPFFPAVDDYLHQAADPANWPVGITYDPDGDGTAITSLGVHEHWNNKTDKQYTRNIMADGVGVELVSIPESLVKYSFTDIESNTATNNLTAYPNPCSIATTLSFTINDAAFVEISLISMDGKLIQKLVNKSMVAGMCYEDLSLKNLNPGIYLCAVKITSQQNTELKTIKLEVQ